MPTLKQRLAICFVTVLSLFAGSPARAEDTVTPEQVEQDDLTPRGNACRSRCDEAYERDNQNCRTIPERYTRRRERCWRRANEKHGACYANCDPGTRDCLDEDDDDATTPGCATPLQNDD
jgi:hypothetical protein